MLARWLILDGNNLIHRHAAWADLARHDFALARRRLVLDLEECAGSLAERITVVFDGTGGNTDLATPAGSPVEVVFSSSRLTADSVIERCAHRAGGNRDLLVATSDRLQRDTVEAAGVATISAVGFLEALERELRELRATTRRAPGRSSRGGGTLGEFFGGGNR